MAVLIGALLAVELLLISLLYQHNFEFVCRDAAPAWFCAFAGRIVPRAFGVLAAFALFLLAQPKGLKALWGQPSSVLRPLLLNVAGVILIVLPWIFVGDDAVASAIVAGALMWGFGGAFAALGIAGLFAPKAHWFQFLRSNWATLAPLLLAGIALPEVSDQVQYVWRNPWLTDLTFDAVVEVMTAIGYDVTAVSATKVIGAADFFVAVGRQCSGAEGFALISVFLTIYMTLFRADLRFPHVLLLFPIGIAVSWVFNVIRISVLLIIGIETSPELAIGGFHSHAGWVAFTGLSLGLIAVSRMVPFFRKETLSRPTSLPPFFADPVVGQILPFAVFMLSALFASTVSETPSVLYPARVVLILIAFWFVRDTLRNLPWRIDPLSIVCGLGIGLAWLASAPPPSDGLPPFGELAGLAFVAWVLARVIGTVVLVPILEELMFRGYILDRIAPTAQGVRMVAAIAFSAALFGMLHDRWIAAALAGLVFGLLVWRSKNLTDPILAHAVANGTIATYALATGAWHVI